MAVLQKGPAVFVEEAKNNADMGASNKAASESESESESELESEEDDDEVRLTEPSENAIYDRDGILDKLGDIRWPENVEWIHKLSVDINQEQEVDVNDDLIRELAFYTQALEGTKEAFLKLQSMELQFLKPSDYHGAMVKTDTHMEEVKSQLLAEKKSVEEAEERKKDREKKNTDKEVQAHKLKEKAKQKKDGIESGKKWKKQREQSDFSEPAEDGDIGLAFEDKNTVKTLNKKMEGLSPGDHSGGKAGQDTGKGKKLAEKKRKNRDFRDAKYGFGGKRGMKKQNTADSTNDVRSFKKGRK